MKLHSYILPGIVFLKRKDGLPDHVKQGFGAFCTVL